MNNQTRTRRNDCAYHRPLHSIIGRNRYGNGVVRGIHAAIGARLAVHRQICEPHGRKSRRDHRRGGLDHHHVGSPRQIRARPLVGDGSNRRRRIARQHQPSAAPATRGKCCRLAHVDGIARRTRHRGPSRREVRVIDHTRRDRRRGTGGVGFGIVITARGPERLGPVVRKGPVVVGRTGPQPRVVIACARTVVNQRAARERLAHRRGRPGRRRKRAGRVVHDHHVVTRIIRPKGQIDLRHTIRRRRKLLRWRHCTALRRHRSCRRIAAHAASSLCPDSEVIGGIFVQPGHRHARCASHLPVFVAGHESATAAAARSKVIEIGAASGSVIDETAINAEIRRGVIHRIRQCSAVVRRGCGIGEPGRIIQRELAAGVARHPEVQAVLQRADPEISRRAEVAHLVVAQAGFAPELDVVGSAIHPDPQVISLEVIGRDIPDERCRCHQYHAKIVAR